MSKRDSAFLWETEALRGSPRRGEVADPPTAAPDAERHWVTLREGHYLTGIPIETLRKWARKDAVPTFLSESEIGVRRMIRMDAVRERATRLGRPIAPIPRPEAVSAAPRPQVEVPQALEHEAQPEETEPPPEPPAARDGGDGAASPVPGAEDQAPPAGTMIVPVAAWDKMLMQLGNLHEAGQQLAEARERAAKAETEAKFLRERLGEMRRDLEASRREEAQAPTPIEAQPSAEPDPVAEPVATPSPEPVRPPRPEPARQPEKLWRYIYRGWRDRRR